MVRVSSKKGKGSNRQAVALLAERAQQRQQEGPLLDLIESCRYAEAEQSARAVLRRQPGNLSAKKVLSVALLYQEQKDEAISLCRQLVEDSPNDWECWGNLAFIERDTGDWKASAEAYKKALERNPKEYSLCFDYAKLCAATNQSHLALHWFFEALKLKPESRECFLQWVGALWHLRLHEEAMGCLAGAWEDERGDPEIAINLIPVALGLAEWGLLDEAVQHFRRRLDIGHYDDLAPLTLMSLSGFDRGDIFNFIRHRVEERGVSALATDRYRTGFDRPDHERLRIGYLSADIFNHATTYLVNGVLLAHEQAGLDLYIYSYGPNDEGDRRAELEKGATVFRDIQMCSPEQAADLVAADEIDILIDLKGWTKDFRPEIQLLRPAPVVVSWLGYPGSLGHEALADYIIGDPVVTPLEHADGYSEWIAQLPHSYQPNDNRRVLPQSKCRSDVGLPEKAFVFCSFNRVDKLTSTMFRTWCRILKAVPDSVLWLLADFPRAQDNLKRYLQAEGLAPERLIFAPSVSREEHLARLQCADLALDSFPYTAHTTGSDALWAGVPLLTLLGDSFISRVSSSLVTAAGLPEMVTDSLERFETEAIRLALATDELAGMRERLKSGRTTCALFDTQGFARDLAALYRRMWENHKRGQHGPLLADKVTIA